MTQTLTISMIANYEEPFLSALWQKVANVTLTCSCLKIHPLPSREELITHVYLFLINDLGKNLRAANAVQITFLTP